MIQRYLQILGVEVTITSNGEEALTELKRCSPVATSPTNTSPMPTSPPFASYPLPISPPASPAGPSLITSPLLASPSPVPAAYPYDLVLMDLSMPVMDGWEAVKLFRAWEADLSKAGMIFLCSNVVFIQLQELMSQLK